MPPLPLRADFHTKKTRLAARPPEGPTPGTAAVGAIYDGATRADIVRVNNARLCSEFAKIITRFRSSGRRLLRQWPLRRQRKVVPAVGAIRDSPHCRRRAACLRSDRV
jgi:hypothetical protein